MCFPGRKGPSARTAGYCAVVPWPRFNSHDLIQGLAVRALEGRAVGTWHEMSIYPQFMANLEPAARTARSHAEKKAGIDLVAEHNRIAKLSARFRTQLPRLILRIAAQTYEPYLSRSAQHNRQGLSSNGCQGAWESVVGPSHHLP